MGKEKRNSKQRRLAKFGAILTLSSSALVAGMLGQAQTVDTSKNTTSIQLDERNELNLGDELQSKSTHKVTLVENFPVKDELFTTFGQNANISEVYKTYDFQKIIAEKKKKTVYYKAISYSQTQAIIMKMNEFRQMIRNNPSIQVIPSEEYKIVSSHLYRNYADALQDSANWKDSHIIDSTHQKSLSFDSKSQEAKMNFSADDGFLIEGVGFETYLNIEIARENKQLNDRIKADFEDAMEHNLNVTYQGKKYQAIYHKGTRKINHGMQTIDGYFTFSDTTHGLPLQIKNHFIIVSLAYGSSIENLAQALKIHAVKSYEDTMSWNSEVPGIAIGIRYVDELSQKESKLYQIEAKEQIIHSMVFKYITVES
ncbi:MAG: hypothetical protein LBV67_02615 [Streptococcaceae bacterium]|jgi:hypothetical protein|nr:hypothetical protein [Streptococcaceae bacterium]